MRFRIATAALGVLAAAVIASAVAEESAPASLPAAGACALHSPEAETLSSAACAECHDSTRGGHMHPVDLTYASAQARRPGELRAPAEVARLGIRLPGGELRCATCHDGASPWAHYISLPPGSEVRPAFDARALGDGGEAPVRTTPSEGEEVSARPLCVGCHAY